MIYLAYGSNLLSQRLKERTPSARFLGKTTLSRHDLRFHKMGDDQSGKCDAFFTDDAQHAIHGVLFELSDADVAVLDDIEGVGHGYERKLVEVVLQQHIVQALTYVVQPNYIDPNIQPFSWYRDFVLAGALEHDLPKPYIKKIQEVAFKQDLDEDRLQLNQAILERSGVLL